MVGSGEPQDCADQTRAPPDRAVFSVPRRRIVEIIAIGDGRLGHERPMGLG